MIHKNKEEFTRMINTAAAQTGFSLPLIEKDYYITLILSQADTLCRDLVFKGGTCLNKIYFSYYRLSEDLDFSMRLPADDSSRAVRRKCIQPIKDSIESFAGRFDMAIEDAGGAGWNESRQYVYNFLYRSVVLPVQGKIKLEIGLRFNPLLPAEKRMVGHRFLHPFTGEPLFDGGEVNCLPLKEAMAEKLRAGATRKAIAPRDFYDIDFAVRNNVDLCDQEIIEMFKKKLEEDGAETDLSRYRVNLGRRDEEISDMRSRIREELFDVLTPEERGHFDLDASLKRINGMFEKLK